MTAAALVAIACSGGGEPITFDQEGSRTATGPNGTAADGAVVVHVDDAVGPFDRRLLGTNVPAWLLPDLVADPEFRARTEASGTTMLRGPGGSWSNDYDWAGCELADPSRCGATWGLRPSDFADLLEATGLEGMWTVSFNGTAEEAAAAVAYFNGSVDDDRPIGTDRHGEDWQTVGRWARLRADHGHPAPVGIEYWEVGNEIYGAVASAGDECASWGWEGVWTCDGTEYVEGDDEHDGYLQFEAAMHAVDPTIQVGAVGVGDEGEWGDWDREVIDGAGDRIDFYIVHQYGSNGDLPADQVLEVPLTEWPRIVGDVDGAFTRDGLEPPALAITEHNLVAFIDGDDEKMMTQAVNAFYLAETIGQMATNGVTIANQWNLANGRADNGSDYGLIDAQTHERAPAYYALALWSRFGDELVVTDVGDDLDSLIVYGGRAADGTGRLLVINPTSDAVTATLSAGTGSGEVTVDEMVASGLDATDVTFNGSSSPSSDLSEPGRVLTGGSDGEIRNEFPAYSITLVEWGVQS